MKKLIYLITTVLSSAAMLLVWTSHMASAAPAAANTAKPGDAGQALEIAPPVIELKVNPGQTVTTQLSLRGVSKDKLLVTGQVNDFVAAGEDGTPKILMDQSD